METTEFKYTLDTSSKKHRCPRCDKKRFVKYIDIETGQYLNKKYGRCDREIECGYHINPYQNKDYVVDNSRVTTQISEKKPDFIPYEVLNKSRSCYTKNMFVQYLISHFGKQKASKLISTYHIGTSKHWPGATVFWQIDIRGRIRTGKVMLYDESGHRVKHPYNHINWVHALLYDKDNYHLKQCLYGEYLISNKFDKPVALVESEKTAIIGAGYFPDYNWLACGALHNLKPELCNVLIGKHVILFPDLGATEKWREKAKSLSYFCSITVSDLLERKASFAERKNGYDLADYLVRFDPAEFTKKTGRATPFKGKESAVKGKYEAGILPENMPKLTKEGYPATWDIAPPESPSIAYQEAQKAALSDADTDYEQAITNNLKNDMD